MSLKKTIFQHIVIGHSHTVNQKFEHLAESTLVTHEIHTENIRKSKSNFGGV